MYRRGRRDRGKKVEVESEYGMGKKRIDLKKARGVEWRSCWLDRVKIGFGVEPKYSFGGSRDLKFYG